MSDRIREWMKFLAGASAGTAVAQFALGRTGVLPARMWGVTLTPALNGLMVCMAAALSAHLAYFAWRNPGANGDTVGERQPGGYVSRRPPSRSRWLR